MFSLQGREASRNGYMSSYRHSTELEAVVSVLIT
jgi:hypothetical protein